MSKRQPRPDQHARQKTARLLGRYGAVSGAAGPELPREGLRAGGKIEIVHGHEADPYAKPGPGERRNAAPARQRRQRVAINARIDLLEYEHQRGRLSGAAYAAGRYVDRLLEAASGRRSQKEFGEPNRAALSPHALQQTLVARIDAARSAARLKEAMAREIGADGARVIARVIGESLSFREIARLDKMAAGKNRESVPTGGKGRDCERAARLVAASFRDGLEALALVWEKRGKPV